MPYEFLEELATADIAFRAQGQNLEELFVAAADATTNVMIENLDTIRLKEHRSLRLENNALDMLLFDLLQELIYYKDTEQLLLRVRELQIEQREGVWGLMGRAGGEKLDPHRHEQRVDVKAVTLHQFRVEKTTDGWQATVVLDI